MSRNLDDCLSRTVKRAQLDFSESCRFVIFLCFFVNFAQSVLVVLAESHFKDLFLFDALNLL